MKEGTATKPSIEATNSSTNTQSDFGAVGSGKLALTDRAAGERSERKKLAGANYWPKFSLLELTSSQQCERIRGIGGSDANIIMSGDRDRIRQLWSEKRGDAEPPDLSSNLSAMLGTWTEPFNRQWFEKVTGNRVVDVDKVVVCSSDHWRRCTLDGVVRASRAVFEAKHTSAFAKSEDVLERYMPQLQHNLAVTGYQRACLSIIFGNHKYEVFEIAADWLYQSELLAAEAHFWDCVQTGREPVAVDAPPPPRPIGIREVCLEGNNSWASAASDWRKHKDAAKLHATACAAIKGMVEDDVSRAFGHGIEAKRNKSGAITIREFVL